MDEMARSKWKTFVSSSTTPVPVPVPVMGKRFAVMSLLTQL